MVFITGDIHGDPSRLGMNSFYEQKSFDKDKQEDNTVIILGDFGIVWDKEESKNEKYWLDWLESKPFTTVFVDGNHDNFNRLYQFPVKEWNGGKVHELRPHVLHLIRGEIFIIEGKKFFCMGGASSHDIKDGILEEDNWRDEAKKLDKQGKYMYRIRNLSWWDLELPTKEELAHGREVLKKYNNEADYILTHSPSTSELALMGALIGGLYKTDYLTDYLDDIIAETDFKTHFYGHMHVNKVLNPTNVCLYEQILRIV